jgi:hypothetical protein
MWFAVCSGHLHRDWQFNSSYGGGHGLDLSEYPSKNACQWEVATAGETQNFGAEYETQADFQVSRLQVSN